LRCEEQGGVSNDLLADRTPTAANLPTPITDSDPLAAVERLVLDRRHPGVLGLTAALVWGAVGTISALDEVDSFERRRFPLR
jgi:hypothetical protein